MNIAVSYDFSVYVIYIYLHVQSSSVDSKVCCRCSKSELINSDSDSALKLVEYCNGSVKWHFANVIPADCEVANMVRKVFWKGNKRDSGDYGHAHFNIRVLGLLRKWINATLFQLRELRNLPAMWCNACKLQPSCYCVACLFNLCLSVKWAICKLQVLLI